MAKRKKSMFNKAWTILWRTLVVFALILLLFRFVPPPTTAFMLQSDYPVTHHWISIDKLPAKVPLAIIGSEDQRFPQHFGVDFVAITNALSQYDDGEGLRGASTITQQTGKKPFPLAGA